MYVDDTDGVVATCRGNENAEFINAGHQAPTVPVELLI